MRIVKDVQRRNGKGTKGDFKEFIEGTIERSELRKTRDPKRHDWEVLKEFYERSKKSLIKETMMIAMKLYYIRSA